MSIFHTSSSKIALLVFHIQIPLLDNNKKKHSNFVIFTGLINSIKSIPVLSKRDTTVQSGPQNRKPLKKV